MGSSQTLIVSKLFLKYTTLG